jgi:ACS family glucarate transporter-like MFS transporter
LLGFIKSPSFPANARITAMWFPKSERGRASSLFSSSQYFAVGIFSPFAGWLVSALGWPWPFFVLGAIGVFAAVVWIRFMDEPRNHPKVSKAELDYIIADGALVDIDPTGERTTKARRSRAVFARLLTNRMLWCAYIGQYCMIALNYFLITWFSRVQARGMDIMQAGFATIAPSLFGFAGGISGGIISDYLIRIGWSVSWARKMPYVVGMLMVPPFRISTP